MSLDERLGWLLVGCVIGFVLGYIVRALRDIKEELDEVDGILKKSPRSRNDRGFMRFPIISDIALLAVVLLTVWASFSSQHASNQVHEQQKVQTRITSCTNEYLAKTIKALNERTTYSQEQAAANVALQKAQSEFLGALLHVPPYSSEVKQKALQSYFETLNKFVEISGKSDDKVSQNPYPTATEFTDCVNHVLKENQ